MKFSPVDMISDIYFRLFPTQNNIHVMSYLMTWHLISDADVTCSEENFIFILFQIKNETMSSDVG